MTACSRLALIAVLAVAALSPAMAASSDTSQQPVDQWRASKLTGVRVLGPGNSDVGRISDVLMSKDGKATSVVIGIGGILGIGEKDVAIPFGEVTFSDQPITPSSNNALQTNNLAAAAAGTADSVIGAPGASPGTMAGSPGAMAANGGVAPGTTVGLGTPVDMQMAGGSAAGAAAVPRSSTSYPDHATIAMTADQLKSAPAFTFAK